MRLVVMIEPQFGASYADQLRLAKHAEKLDFDGFFRSDHLATMRADLGLPGPTDTWAVLAGLAIETSRLRLGAMVTSATFRLPGPLAVTVATVDHMSGGRVELGLGAGWFEREHRAYAIPFGTWVERFERLEEQLSVITGLWETPPGEQFAFEGKHYRLEQSPALPKPVQQPRPPVIVGGHGERKTPRLAALFADEFNIPFPDSVETASKQFDRVRAACTEHGREPSALRYSAALILCCGRDDAEVKRRAEAIGHDADALRGAHLAGTVSEVVDTIGRYADIGAARLYLQTLDLSDLDHLELIASEVVPQI